MSQMETQGRLLSESFDGVVFLTGSDFENELVSNRFHWVNRFAQHLPVFFLQNGQRKQRFLGRTRFQEVKLEGIRTRIQLASCPRSITPSRARAIARMLRKHGVRKPLFWVYDVANYREILILFPFAFVVLHATENYLMEQSYAPTSAGENTKATRPPFLTRALARYRTGLEKCFRQRIISSLPLVQMVVACSSRIQHDYVESGYQGKTLLIQNGVDHTFWSAPLLAEPEPRVAVFQGAINIRLDFDLLLAVSQLLPDWTFRFVGSETTDPDWTTLKGRDNVEYLGRLPQTALKSIVQNAVVGLIPFKQVPVLYESFPLKAFEYIAAGLPVVSTPIRDLEFLSREKGILQFADHPQAFAFAIESLSSFRLVSSVAERRLKLSAGASYDSKFEKVVSEIHALAEMSARTVQPSKAMLREIRRPRTPNRGVRFTAAVVVETWLTLRGILFSPQTRRHGERS
jgi:glycosyltransferase involved in cell wall biosynthesis